jgi:hypothetical protein
LPYAQEDDGDSQLEDEPGNWKRGREMVFEFLEINNWNKKK